MFSQKQIFTGLGIIAVSSAFWSSQANLSGFLLAKKDTVTICHVPSGETMEVPEQAVEGHLKHGDYPGACQMSSSSAVSSASSSDGSSSSVSNSSVASSESSSSSAASSEPPPPPPPNPPPPPHPIHPEPPSQASGPSHADGPTGGHGHDHAYPLQAVFRGRGLAEQAAALHAIFAVSGLHEDSAYRYTFDHKSIRPQLFASADTETAWMLREHDACCSIYRYLKRIREERPSLKPGYIDWITDQVANALEEDPVEIKAALLGGGHEHAHTSELVRSISEQGCEEDASGNQFVTAHPSAEHRHAAEEISVRQEYISGELTFALMKGDKVFTDVAVSHTKEIHLLVVRDDLRHFVHLHPERDAAGVWHVPFVPEAAGRYRMYLNFIDASGGEHVMQFERSYTGETGNVGIARDYSPERTVGRYNVRLTAESNTSGVMFSIYIRDAGFRTPFLEKYLGALGHGVIISSGGDFIHTHPSPAGDTIIFHTPPLTKDFYRIFVQFQIQEEVFTVDFDWKPPESK